MVAVTGVCPPSRPDGSGSIALASFNIQSGRNGGIEAALRAMKQMGFDIGFLLETKLTGGIYTRHLSVYDVLASNATSLSSGGIALSGGAIFCTRSRRRKFGGPMLFPCI
jgi:hypothetical protein